MFRKLLPALVLLALACASVCTALAADDVTNVVVGDGKSGHSSVNSLTIQGEDIYLDGVLQKEKYRPGTDVIVRDGKTLLVQHNPAKDTEKTADKIAAKQMREREKEALKARLKAEKETLKAAAKTESDAMKASAKTEARAEKEALKREAAAGVEKGKIKTSTGTVINKGGTVRIGNKDYPSSGPATEKDIPPDALKAIEDAKRLGQ